MLYYSYIDNIIQLSAVSICILKKETDIPLIIIILKRLTVKTVCCQKCSVKGYIIKQTCKKIYSQVLLSAKSREVKQMPQTVKECWLKERIS